LVAKVTVYRNFELDPISAEFEQGSFKEECQSNILHESTLQPAHSKVESIIQMSSFVSAMIDMQSKCRNSNNCRFVRFPSCSVVYPSCSERNHLEIPTENTMRKTALTWISALAIASTGLFVQADEKKDGGDGNGRPEREEDGKGKGKGKGDRSEMMKKIFAQLDEDGSESLSVQELAKARPLQDKNRKEVKEIFDKKDLNGDGEIGKGEFAKTFGPPRGKGGKGKGGPPRGKGGKGGKADGKGGKDNN
jgi:hypothetical protein